MYILFIITVINFGGPKPLIATQEFSTAVKCQDQANRILATYPSNVEAYCTPK